MAVSSSHSGKRGLVVPGNLISALAFLGSLSVQGSSPTFPAGQQMLAMCKPSSFCSSRRAQPEATHGRAEKSLQAELPSPPGNISGLLPGRRAPAITLPHSSECLQLVASVSCHQLSSLDSGNHHCLLLSSFSQTFFPKARLLGCAHRGLLGHGFPVSSAAVSCEHSSQLSPLMRHS